MYWYTWWSITNTYTFKSIHTNANTNTIVPMLEPKQLEPFQLWVTPLTDGFHDCMGFEPFPYDDDDSVHCQG